MILPIDKDFWRLAPFFWRVEELGEEQHHDMRLMYFVAHAVIAIELNFSLTFLGGRN